jgi:hypothetical protein
MIPSITYEKHFAKKNNLLQKILSKELKLRGMICRMMMTKSKNSKKQIGIWVLRISNKIIRIAILLE